MPEQVDCWRHLIPLIFAGMEFAQPRLAKILQPFNMNKISTVEGLKQCFEANNDKWRSMDNFCQELMVLKCSFRSRSIVESLVAKRYMKLAHTMKEVRLKGNYLILRTYFIK